MESEMDATTHASLSEESALNRMISFPGGSLLPEKPDIPDNRSLS